MTLIFGQICLKTRSPGQPSKKRRPNCAKKLAGGFIFISWLYARVELVPHIFGAQIFVMADRDTKPHRDNVQGREMAPEMSRHLYSLLMKIRRDSFTWMADWLVGRQAGGGECFKGRHINPAGRHNATPEKPKPSVVARRLSRPVSPGATQWRDKQRVERAAGNSESRHFHGQFLVSLAKHWSPALAYTRAPKTNTDRHLASSRR